MGERRPIWEAPAFTFEADDHQAVEALVSLTLNFDNDALCISADREFVVTTSNDGFVDFYARRQPAVDSIEAALAWAWPGWRAEQEARQEAELARIHDEIRRNRRE